METILKNWYIELQVRGKTRIARGAVFNSPKFPDNDYISTSKIIKIVPDDMKECLEIHTKNSVYYCYWKDCNFEKCRRDSKNLPGFEKYWKRYVEESLLPVEKESIILVYRNTTSFFPYVFFRQENEVRI